MTQTIYDCLSTAGFGVKRYTGDIGIEIETETLKPYDPPELKLWSHHRDNSLRDFGIEYVLKGPVAYGNETRDALGEWDTKVNKVFKLKKDSFSTSVHIHLNILNKTWLQMANFLVAYYLVENILIRMSGPDRRSNLFCLPLCDAEGELPVITETIRHIGNLNYRKLVLPIEAYKYAALNLCNISKLGTLEVRSMRGVTDISVIQDWIDVLMSIMTFAITRGVTPLGILDMYENQGPDALADTIFGDSIRIVNRTLEAFNVKETKAQLIEPNLWYAAKIATASKFDVENWGFPKPKKILREKYDQRLDAVAMELNRAPFSQLPYALRLVVKEIVERELNSTRADIIFVNGDQ